MKLDKKQISKIAWLVFLLLPILAYLPYIIRSEMPGGVDTLQFFLRKRAWAESVLQGEIPQWNKYLANGMPQSGVTDFYIVSTVLSFLPLCAFVWCFYIFHWFMASYFFYRYLRESGCAVCPAYIMGILFECSIHINGLRKGHPSVLAAVCLFPLVMFLVKKFFNTKKSMWLFLSAIASGIRMTIGTQYGTYAVLLLFFYMLFRGIWEKYPVKELLIKGAAWALLFLGTYAYALLPNSGILREYSAYGSSGIGWDTFASYSMHPIKLLQMIYPTFFGDVYQAMGPMHSSEYDIEIYLGIFILFLVCSAVRTCKKKPEMLLEILLAGFALVYACVAHFSVLGELIYRIPILGSFRCPARILYLFIFFLFSLAGREFSDIWEEAGRGEYGRIRFIRKAAKILLGITGAVLISSVFSAGVQGGSDQLPEAVAAARNCFGKPMLVMAAVLLATGLCEYGFPKKTVWKKRVLAGALLLLTLAEAGPYSLETHTNSIASIGSDDTVLQLKTEHEEYKVLDALGSIDVVHKSLISQNRSTLLKVPGINAYTAYNNPALCKFLKPSGMGKGSKIPFSMSGMLTGSHNMKNILYFQKDLLSMLGVRYLIDSDKIIEASSGMVSDGTKETLYQSQEEACIQGTKGGVGVLVLPVEVRPDSYYKVKFRIRESDQKKLTRLFTDIFGGAGYDNGAQEVTFSVPGEKNEYEACLYSGDFAGASETVCIRIGAGAETDEIAVEAVSVSLFPGVEGYQYYTTDDAGNRIYVNEDARPVLYFAEEKRHIDTADALYQATENLNLDTVAYVAGESEDYKNSEADVQLLSYTNNRLEAEAVLPEKGFLCFSQNYSPHWSVYVDGEKQEVQLVNGLIMGVELPKGEHEIRFSYWDPSYLAGKGITLVTLLCFLGYLIWERKKKKSGK